MKFEKDYYRILEVSPLADAAAIKKAYRQLAHRYHPDKNPDSGLSEQSFREIKEAYEVLGQQSLRAHYDEWRWLTGRAYRRQKQMPTATWLIAQAKDLAVQVSQLEPYQIEQPLLWDYLNFLLSDAHVAVLAAATAEEREQFLEWLCQALPRLSPAYLPAVVEKAISICSEDAGCRWQLVRLQRKWKQEEQWRRIKPMVLLAAVLVLVLFMYFWTGRR